MAAKSVGLLLYVGLGVLTAFFLNWTFFPEDPQAPRYFFLALGWNVIAWALAAYLFSPPKEKSNG